MATLKEALAAIASFTITLGSLANGSGRQGTLVDNTTNLAIGAYISVSIKLGTSPTANTTVSIYLIRSDNNTTAIEDDGAGASDAAWTQKNAVPIMILTTGGSPATGDVLKGVVYVPNLGPKFTVGVVNNSGVALDATNGNHVISYIGVTETIA